MAAPVYATNAPVSARVSAQEADAGNDEREERREGSAHPEDEEDEAGEDDQPEVVPAARRGGGAHGGEGVRLLASEGVRLLE